MTRCESVNVYALCALIQTFSDIHIVHSLDRCTLFEKLVSYEIASIFKDDRNPKQIQLYSESWCQPEKPKNKN